jgi:hypothetical protein
MAAYFALTLPLANVSASSSSSSPVFGPHPTGGVGRRQHIGVSAALQAGVGGAWGGGGGGQGPGQGGFHFRSTATAATITSR